MENCVFCLIVEKRIPAEVLFEDEDCICIRDNKPLAPIHLLVIPKSHFASLNELDDSALAGHLLLTTRKIAQDTVGADGGYRVVINTGAQGGQTIFHLHIHIIAGKSIGVDLLTKGLQ